VGIVKGSGMIMPDMATMLGFIFTDAVVSAGLWQQMLQAAVAPTFNSITVDSDTSTSDTVLAFATGGAGHPVLTSMDDAGADALAAALADVCRQLAILVVRDGEGAQKLIEVNVAGAVDDASAKRVAMSIANSPLLKTAIAGGDANWGRVVMAVGKAGEPAERDLLSIRFGDTLVADKGMVVPGYDEAPVAAHLAGQEVRLTVDLGLGNGRARVWTCDLTHGYISINADYRS
jgi:glutamate N-acetyltransferase/amino-acid N-acetyltransferase